MSWQFRMLFLLFILMLFCDTQVLTASERITDIQIVPPTIPIDSTSSTKFLCTNHRSNESELEAEISKSISSDQIKISTISFNKTSKQIQLDVKDYIGCFELLCYVKGQRSNGIYADITVKAPPGVLQIVSRCQVHERQYIKCMIRAPVIATAIMNGCPERFRFEEERHPFANMAYRERPEFLNNESTKEVLVFKFKPVNDGEFPNNLRMNMTQMLRHFEPSWYVFDMTPIYIVKPKFIVKDISSRTIQVNLSSTTPPAFCERNLVPSSSSMLNRTWTVIESGRNSFFMDNLQPNTLYRVCIKCRQVYNDPEGLEECQEIKTPKDNTILMIVVGSLMTVAVIVMVVLFVLYKRKKHRYDHVTKKKIIRKEMVSNRYDREPTQQSRSNISLESDGTGSQLLIPPQYMDDSGMNYLPIASAHEVIDASFPKYLDSSNS